MKKEKCFEMHIEEMKAAKHSWQGWLKVAKRLLNRIQSMEETKENRYDLKSLEMSYKFIIEQIQQMVKIYGALIDLAQDCELVESDFIDAMKSLQIYNKELRKEYKKKTFKELNNKYINGIREAEIIIGI